MPKVCKKHFYINDNKQRITVTISNGSSNVEASTIVEHVTTDSSGYTTTTHTVFEDYYSKLTLGERVKRVTAKVLQHWDSVAQQIYAMNLPQIQKMYPK